MHLGNIFTAVVSYVAAHQSEGGRWILRIEDLDPQRSKQEYARRIEDDLQWLGLQWDNGGLDGDDASGPYVQSRRGHIYEKYYNQLNDSGLIYPCTCTRADLNASNAPHASDGRRIYAGTCRPPHGHARQGASAAGRIMLPSDMVVTFNDVVCGPQSVDLVREVGDFVLRRADGAWAYQLAVVVDDALMGVNMVVRGNDLLSSAAQQIYLYRLLGFEPPRFAHLPLIVNAAGQRLSKRDSSLAMDQLRKDYTPGQLLGLLGHIMGLCPEGMSLTVENIVELFNWDCLAGRQHISFEATR